MSLEKSFNNRLPKYGEKPDRPGLYLGLFHGRDTPDEEMNEWGFEGPMIGPLRWVHTTYAFTIRIEFVHQSDALRYFSSAEVEQDLTFSGDMLAFGDQFFGDWTVYVVRIEDCKGPSDTFRRNKRSTGPRTHSLCID